MAPQTAVVAAPPPQSSAAPSPSPSASQRPRTWPSSHPQRNEELQASCEGHEALQTALGRPLRLWLHLRLSLWHVFDGKGQERRSGRSLRELSRLGMRHHMLHPQLLQLVGLSHSCTPRAKAPEPGPCIAARTSRSLVRGAVTLFKQLTCHLL